MELQYVYTRLNVENFQACKAFYRDILGLAIALEDDMDEYVEFATGAVRITLFNRAKVSDFIPRSEPKSYDPTSARVVLAFQVKDLEAAVSELRKRSVEIINAPTNYPDRGFMSACFRDPDGNLIGLEQIVDVLVM